MGESIQTNPKSKAEESFTMITFDNTIRKGFASLQSLITCMRESGAKL